MGSTGGTLGTLLAHQPSRIYSSLKISNSIQLGSSVSRGLSHTDLLTGSRLGNVLRVTVCRSEGGRLGQEEKLHWIQRQEDLPSHGGLSSLGQDPEMLRWPCWQLGRVWKETGWMRTIQNSTRASRITAEPQWEVTQQSGKKGRLEQNILCSFPWFLSPFALENPYYWLDPNPLYFSLQTCLNTFLDQVSSLRVKRSTFSIPPSRHDWHYNIQWCFLVCLPIKLPGLFWMRENETILLIYALKKKMLGAQSCLTVWGPVDYSPPGSSVHGIIQAKLLEWVTIPFSRGLNLHLLHWQQILFFFFFFCSKFFTTKPPEYS